MTVLINNPDFLVDPAYDTVNGTDLAYDKTEKGIGGDFYRVAGDEYLQSLANSAILDQLSDFTIDAVVKLTAIKGTGHGFTIGGRGGTSWMTLQLTDPTVADQVTQAILSFFDGSSLTTTILPVPSIDITTDPVIRIVWEYRGSSGFPQTSITLRNAADAIVAQIDNNLSGDFAFANFGVLNRPDLILETTPFTSGFLTKLILSNTVTETGLTITTELVIAETAQLLNRRSNILNISNRDVTIQRWIDVAKSLALRDIDLTEAQLTSPITNYTTTQVTQLQTQFREALLSRVIARALSFMNDSRAKYDEPNLKQTIMDHEIRANELLRDIATEFHPLTSDDGESIPMMGLRIFEASDQIYGPINVQGSGYTKRPIDPED